MYTVIIKYHFLEVVKMQQQLDPFKNELTVDDSISKNSEQKVTTVENWST